MKTPEDKTPEDLELETLILSATLFCCDCREHVMMELTTSDFHCKDNASVFLHMKDLFARNIRFDVNILCAEIQTNKSEGIKSVFVSLYDQMLSPDYVSMCVKDLKQVTRKRAFYFTCKDGARSFSGNSPFSQEKYANWARTVQDLTCSYDNKKSYSKISESLDPFLESIEHKQDCYRKGIPIKNGFPTGFADIDEIFGGFKEGHLTIIGARPGVGKTTFMCNLALNIIRNSDTPIGIFSLEMPLIEVVDKLIKIEAELDSNAVNLGSTSKQEHEHLIEVGKRVCQKPILIDETSRLNMALLESRAEYWTRKYGIKVLFIDYLQLISAGKFNNKYEEITHISQRLKMMAKSLNICVVSLAQLNRGAEKNERPKISDLRDSGSLEADSDEIFLLNDPSAKDSYNKKNQLEVYLGKNRFGATGNVNLYFDKPTGKMNNLEPFDGRSEFDLFIQRVPD